MRGAVFGFPSAFIFLLLLCLGSTKTFLQHYHAIYHEMMEGDSTLIPKRTPQFVLYKNGDVTGFGNKMRGLYSSLLLALATDRILVIDFPAFFDHFLPPDGLKMNFKLQFGIKAILPMKQILIGGRDDPGQDRPLLQTADLQQLYANVTTISYAFGYGFDQELMMNPHVRHKLAALLGLRSPEDYTQLYGTGTIMPWLLQNITEWYRRGIDSIVSALNLPILAKREQGSLICARLRIMDGRNRYQLFADCFRTILRRLLDGSWKLGGPDATTSLDSYRIFFTTDKPRLAERFNEEFASEFGAISMNPRQEHRETNRVGNMYSPELGEDTLPHPAMIDWFILGECDYVIGSHSTFSLSAAARNGNRPSQKMFTTPPLFKCAEMTPDTFRF